MSSRIQNIIKGCWHLLKTSAIEFINDSGLKLSASLSYYTIFSLPPLLLIIISSCGIFFGEDAVSGRIYHQINGLLGNVVAYQIQDMIKSIKLSGDNHIAIYAGVIILIIGASGVFAEIQDSINYIWGLYAKPKKGLIKFIKNRLISFSMIGVFSFLFLVSLLVNSLMDVLNNVFTIRFEYFISKLYYTGNLLILFITITILFLIIFRTMPDGKVALKDGLIGASFTALLFMVGKFAIGAYLGNSNIASAYGAAGSVIVILAWIYYSAIILYFGAEFTKVYAYSYGKKIIPKEYSFRRKKDNFN
jgi:membrane protein